MEELVLKSTVKVAQMDELTEEERNLVSLAIEGADPLNNRVVRVLQFCCEF